MDGATGEIIPTGLVILMTEKGNSVGSTLSDDEGWFSISSPRPGSFFLIASAWGYEEAIAGIFELGQDGRMSFDYRLAPAPLPLEQILVELDAGRPLLHKVVSSGFVRRMQRGLGQFYTPYEIENAVDTRTSEVLSRRPGVFARYPSSTDGVGVDGLVPLSDLEAAEVYRRPAQIPVEYGMGGRAGEDDAFNPCGIVLLWTKAR